MKSYEAEAEIAASPDQVWAVLTDGDAYPQWDSGVTRIEGEIAEGAKIKVHAEVSPGRAFPVKVTELRPGRRMVWQGGMPLGLFRGVRTFELTARDGAGTHFRTREEYTGPLLPLIWRSMPDLQPSFDQFARGLKERSEASGS